VLAMSGGTVPDPAPARVNGVQALPGLAGKVCIVTGASRGIGLATAKRLSVAGADVLLVARDEQALRDATRTAGGEYLVADVTHPAAGRRVVEACVERMGGVDVLVNNAGTARVVGIEQIDDEEFERQWQLNVLAPFGLMRAAAPVMARRGAGRIVNVASSAAHRSTSLNLAYSITKAAQLALSRGFAAHWAAHGVLVNAVVPGPVATDLWTGAGGLGEQIAGPGRSATAMHDASGQIPLGRFAQPDEIATVIAVLCSALASAVAGAAWAVDGGVSPSV
jgi:3-oxoacyl-[acyl-carrier protein] reductase